MINLISPDTKRDYKAARTNVALIQCCVIVLALAGLVGATYGAGFWMTLNDHASASAKLEDLKAEATQFQEAQEEAKTFRENLKIAKIILDNNVNYSEFMLTLANDIPPGTMISSINLGGAKTATQTNTMDLLARAASYDAILDLKTSLETSALFENVSIINYTRPEKLEGLTGAIAKYPYEVSLSATPTIAAKAGGLR